MCCSQRYSRALRAAAAHSPELHARASVPRSVLTPLEIKQREHTKRGGAATQEAGLQPHATAKHKNSCRAVNHSVRLIY